MDKMSRRQLLKGGIVTTVTMPYVVSSLRAGTPASDRITMGAIGLGEIVNALAEALTWNGQTAREQAGQYARNRSRQG